jgi:hypothetical protein
MRYPPTAEDLSEERPILPEIYSNNEYHNKNVVKYILTGQEKFSLDMGLIVSQVENRRHRKTTQEFQQNSM